MTTMSNSSYLVQRLSPPGPLASLGLDNPFAFGVVRNGGLSTEAMALLRNIFRFDYMGSAEYEFGAVPRALQEIARQMSDGGLRAWHFDIPLSQVRPDFRDKTKPEKGATGRVYVLAATDWAEEVEQRIRAMAKEGYTYRAKADTLLDQVLRPNPDPSAYRTKVCGWLELDNGYFFFTDETMWRQTCALFDVEVPQGATA